ncbi:MAG: vWA domain-containing protein [Candidatus Methylomirabilia bacterium]
MRRTRYPVRHQISAAMALVLALVIAHLAPAGARAAEIKVSAGFDNGAVYVSDPDERFLEIEVTAPERGLMRRPLQRPRLNIALVVDKSGSMAEARKIDFVREAAHRLVDELQPGDRFALVTYDDQVDIPIPSEAFEDRRLAHRVIDGIRPGGATNLGGGLVEGFRQVRRRYDPEGINRVLLLSDGLANRGITAPDELSHLAAGEGEGGISVTTFGVGSEFNEDLLSGLAESGHGTYYYIDRAQRIPELLAREFSTLQNVYAADVEITIEVHAEVVINEILGYRFRREGNRYVVSVGSLAAGERRRVMCRVAPPRWARGSHRIGQVLVRYQLPGERRPVSSSQELRLNWLDDRGEVSREMNRDISERSAVFQANVARQKAAVMVDKGDVAGAKQVLSESKAKLAASPVQSEGVRRELGENEVYGQAISAPMSAAEQSAVQKDVKYRSYKTLQQK